MIPTEHNEEKQPAAAHHDGPVLGRSKIEVAATLIGKTIDVVAMGTVIGPCKDPSVRMRLPLPEYGIALLVRDAPPATAWPVTLVSYFGGRDTSGTFHRRVTLPFPPFVGLELMYFSSFGINTVTAVLVDGETGEVECVVEPEIEDGTETFDYRKGWYADWTFDADNQDDPRNGMVIAGDHDQATAGPDLGATP